jgi:hypothetical protein
LKKIIVFIIFSFNLFAAEVFYLARSPKALLMGDAFTALADDEYTLFYNPAALGRNKGVSFTPFAPSFALTDFHNDLTKFSNMPSGTNAASGYVAKFLDYPIYLGAQAHPGLKMGQFGFNLFLNNQTSMVIRNATHPILDINYQYDRGFIAGFAYTLGSGATTKKGKKKEKEGTEGGERISIGASVKHLNRQAIRSQYDIFGANLLNTLTSGVSSPSALKNALGSGDGDAWGFDLGAEWVKASGPTTISAGYSLMDIGSTRFRKTGGVNDVPDQPMMANAGVAFKQDFGFFDYSFSADLHPFLGKVDFARQFHFGVELSFPFISILAGWSEGYTSYGASIKLWPFKIITGLYSAELGSHFREEEAKRFILYLSLFDFSIDL